MIRFVSLDSLLRIFLTGLLLIVIFGLARSSPSALRSYEGPTLKSAAAIKGVVTPSAARLLVASSARLVVGPRRSSLSWSGLMGDSVELTRQPAPAGNPAGKAVESTPQIKDNGPKIHGGLAE